MYEKFDLRVFADYNMEKRTEVVPMKRIVTLFLAFVLLCTLAAPALAFEKAQRSSQALSVDGVLVDCDKYNIDGSNYFKLRDLAKLLDGTGSQFDVAYDSAKRVISVTTGHTYVQPDGSELAVGEDKSGTTRESSQTIMIDGALRSDLTAYNIGGNNYFQLRQLGEALGFDVGYDTATRTMLVTSRSAATPDAGETVTFEQKQVAGLSATVLTVNIRNPRVRLETSMVDGTVGARAPFADIVAAAGDAVAVLTGNFMNGDQEGNFPVGHVMSNGELKYIGSGYTTIGITDGGEVRFGRPSIRIRMKPTEREYNMYTAIGLNLKEHEQEANFSVLYTPAYGLRFEVTCAGSVTVVKDGRVTNYGAVVPGDKVGIPENGYVLWLSDTYMNEFVWNFESPAVGEGMELEYFVFGEEEEGFSLDGVTQLIAGAPRLVKNGEICNEQEPQFSGDRFTETYVSGRTAAGVTADGKLIFLQAGATLPQLKEAMLALGCVNAVNLDGGASVGMYYNGTIYATPGRNLATTIRIFVD